MNPLTSKVEKKTTRKNIEKQGKGGGEEEEEKHVLFFLGVIMIHFWGYYH